MTAATEEKPTGEALADAVKEAAKAPAQTPPEKASETLPEDTGNGSEDTEKGSETPPEKPADDPAPLVKDDGTPYTRADVDGLQTALKAARKEARDHKAALDALKAKGGDRPLDEVVAEVETTAAAKWKPLMVRAAARAAFAEAGLSLPEGRQEEALARAVRLLDEDTLTISDAGTVEGLAEQVESIRSDFPDLFSTAPQRRPRIQAADRQGAAKPPASAADRLAAALLGRP
jgi:hypothetical protein